MIPVSWISWDNNNTNTTSKTYNAGASMCKIEDALLSSYKYLLEQGYFFHNLKCAHRAVGIRWALSLRGNCKHESKCNVVSVGVWHEGVFFL